MIGWVYFLSNHFPTDIQTECSRVPNYCMQDSSGKYTLDHCSLVRLMFSLQSSTSLISLLGLAGVLAG